MMLVCIFVEKTFFITLENYNRKILTLANFCFNILLKNVTIRDNIV